MPAPHTAHELRYAVDEIVDADGVVLAEREFGGLAEQRAGQLLLPGELEFKGLNARLEEPLPLWPLPARQSWPACLAPCGCRCGHSPTAHAVCVVCRAEGTAMYKALMKADTASANPVLPSESASWPRSRLI